LLSDIGTIQPEIAEETIVSQDSNENIDNERGDTSHMHTSVPEEESVPLSALDADAKEQQQPSEPTSAFTKAAESPCRRESTATYATGEVNEKGNGLGVQLLDSRPASQVRSRRSQYLGPTQYTPVASSKKAALARGAPGLSYMFSPTISTSRPSSVIGISTPPQPPPARVQQTHFLESPELAANSSDFDNGSGAHIRPKDFQETAASSNPQGASNVEFADSRKDSRSYGAINIGALEQFLDEGEIPASTSEEEYSDDGLEWDKGYPGSSSQSKVSSSDQSTFSSTKASRPPPPPNGISPRYGSLPRQHPNIPRSRYASEGSINRVLQTNMFSSSSMPDER
ncbi:hypothetical protein J3B02_006207, partial [Coemansia erecta]